MKMEMELENGEEKVKCWSKSNRDICFYFSVEIITVTSQALAMF